MAPLPAIPVVREPGQTTLNFSSSIIRKKPGKPAMLMCLLLKIKIKIGDTLLESRCLPKQPQSR